MDIQQDSKMRIVAESNLRAMCERVSGTCHRYWIEKVTEHRAYVCYSNPDEYGNESSMTAVYPAYPACAGGGKVIVLDALRIEHDNQDGEGWQAFDVLLECPVLLRNPPPGYDWEEYNKACRRKFTDKRSKDIVESKQQGYIKEVARLPMPEQHPVEGDLGSVPL